MKILKIFQTEVERTQAYNVLNYLLCLSVKKVDRVAVNESLSAGNSINGDKEVIKYLLVCEERNYKVYKQIVDKCDVTYKSPWENYSSDGYSTSRLRPLWEMLSYES